MLGHRVWWGDGEWRLHGTDSQQGNMKRLWRRVVGGMNISTPTERALMYIHLLVSVLYGAVCTPWHTCGSHWTTGGNLLSPSTTWFPVLNSGVCAQWQVPLLTEVSQQPEFALKKWLGVGDAVQM